jgi:hypothetical protein
VRELKQKAGEKRRRFDPLDLVRAKLREPALSFGPADTLRLLCRLARVSSTLSWWMRMPRFLRVTLA